MAFLGNSEQAAVRTRLLLIAMILGGAGLRMAGLFSIGLSSDEALFATWAKLINTGRDPLLTATAVDKPPVLFYVQAAFLGVLDSAEIAPLIPNLVASLLLIPLTYILVKLQFNDHRGAMLAALLVTVSPFLIRFSATAFTDPLALTLFAASAVCAIRGRSIYAGLLFALAIGTRFPIVILLPILLTLQAGKFRWRRFLMGGAPIILLLGCWIWLTQGKSWLSSGDATLLRGLRPIASWELLPRLENWQIVLDGGFGFSIWMLALLPIVILSWQGVEVDKLYLGYALLFFAFHWLFATATYDRYLLPLVWLLTILLARSVSLAPRMRFGRLNVQTALVVFVLFGSVFAVDDRAGGISADSGTATLTSHFADHPYGTVLYDHWYSWQSRYYLFDERVHVAWIAHPDSLVENLDVFYDDNRYIILPDDARSERFHNTLTLAGYHLEKRLQSGEISVYKIAR